MTEKVQNKPEQNNQEQNLENWLPITASRKAKWWYSTFHNITALVGAGVLGLPYAVSQLGWTAGIIAIMMSWLITFYTLWLLVEMHEIVPGKRFDRYHQLGEYALGPKLGYWMVTTMQLTVQVATSIVYSVTGGSSLKKALDLIWPQISGVRETYYIIMFVVLQLLLSQTPNFNKLKIVSLTAAIMSIFYSMTAFVASLVKGIGHHPSEYTIRSHTTPGQVFDVFNALGTIAFAFAGHSVVLEIQATLPSTPEIPSKKPMWRGLVAAYFVVIACYLLVAISGYWAFGAHVEDNVLLSLEHPKWIIAAANFMVLFHVIGSYQVFAMPIFDTIESFLVQKRNFAPSRTLRVISRSAFVVVIGIVAIIIPFFGGLLGFFGGLAFVSTAYILPSILWLAITKPKRWSLHWNLSMFCAICGVLIACVAPIGGIRTIIVSAKTYKMFS
ncbi:lysine histidine transporter-like 5 [Senna tora]|uniref:Lysine histidine transporter-like 5 n=1 Tax=Senna tora TaxID=362788 RepID=A0A835CCY2_9FABA|nr:lysine histidine transporter-like 5 [Senna tora]